MKTLPSFPIRPHVGCDEMCSDCADVLDHFEEKLRPIVRHAVRAFWRDVHEQLPGLLEARPPYYAKADVADLEGQALQSVVYWAFERWQERHAIPVLLPEPPRERASPEESSNEELDHAGAAVHP